MAQHTSLDKVSNAFNVVIQWLCVSEHVGVFFKQNIIRGTHVCLLLAAKCRGELPSLSLSFRRKGQRVRTRKQLRDPLAAAS